MRIVDASVSLLAITDQAERLVERAGRVCYKSEGRIGPSTYAPFILGLLKRGHESVLEHASATLLFTCDRGISHELVRHRLASFSQESTRYVGPSLEEAILHLGPDLGADSEETHRNVGRGVGAGGFHAVKGDRAHIGPEAQDWGLTFVRPSFLPTQMNTPLATQWLEGLAQAERAYFRMLQLGARKEEARTLLPNSLKTDLVVTANFREWRHILHLRLGPKAHPDMRSLMAKALALLTEQAPTCFQNLDGACGTSKETPTYD